MVQSLEQYVAQATQAYQPSQTAIQNQINALAGQLATANQQINKNYAQQQSTLNRNRNIAAETASMQAAGSGGSFGGAANIANRKYYEQSFVPAQTQLQTNQANELAQAKQNSENQRTSLNSQLSELQAQANKAALAQYYSDLANEQQRQWQAEQNRLDREASLKAARASAAAANPYQYLPDGYGNTSTKLNKANVSFADWLNSDSYGALKYAQGANQAEKVNYLRKMATGYNAALKNSKNLLGQATLNKLYGTNIYKAYENWRNS